MMVRGIIARKFNIPSQNEEDALFIPIQYEGKRALYYFRHLIDADKLPVIASDIDKLKGTDPWPLDERKKRELIAPTTKGGKIYVDVEGLGRKLLPFMEYTDLEGKTHYYVGHEAVYFRPPFKERPPPALRRTKQWIAWVEKYPNAYKEWKKEIERESERMGCICQFNGGSWHLYLQECVCPADSLETSLKSAIAVLQDKALF